MDVPSVTVAGFPADALVVDVREQNEWDAGHVDGSVHVPMSDFVARQEEIPKDRDVVLVCTVGGRSGRVTGYLRQTGWTTVRNLEGGLLEWVGAGRPLVSETGQPPYVVT